MKTRERMFQLFNVFIQIMCQFILVKNADVVDNDFD